MKKSILTLLTISLSICAFAQENDYSGAIGTKTESVTESNNNKNSLWSSATAWANSVSTDYQKKILSEDKDNGTIILKVESYLPSGTAGINEYSKIKVIMNVKIDCRDKKYRTILSNFTSAIGIDRSVEVNNLPATQLESMMKELQCIKDLSVRDFKNEAAWNIDNILSAKNKYLARVKDDQEAISLQDVGSKSGAKEVKKRTAWIAANNETISFLDFILKGFGKKTDEINASLNKSMKISDDF
ncbi:DUF4468 domain-containing protein [Pedobacter nyackensis]|uniref:DUF4468 domain-containing protein n=1 Tax=Pedobacter nyackensis TaxID=475255 RepID=UPI0029307916|nr:DUF4468 domain-containing protein [Pedobacter nyackensis]